MRIVLMVLALVLSGCGNDTESPDSAPPSQRKATTHPAWSYFAEQDKMTDKIYRTASLSSSDNLHEDFPYKSAPMKLRVNEVGGMSISTGGHQFDCSSAYGCKISIRMDGGTAREIDAFNLDMDPPTLIFSDEQLLTDLESAKVMLVQAPLFRRGYGVVTFDVSGFDPSRIKAAQP